MSRKRLSNAKTKISQLLKSGKFFLLVACLLLQLGIAELVYATKTFESKLREVDYTWDGVQHSFTLHWTESGQENNNIIVAIHGTPGGWGAWRAFMQHEDVLENYRILSIDRPGWGNSQFSDGRIEPQFHYQQAIIEAWLHSYLPEIEPAQVLVMGHSWGATLAASLLADNPEIIDGGVVVAGPFDPLLSEPRWYHNWAKNGLIKSIIGKNMRRSNLEMLPLWEELIVLNESWHKIQKPILLIQGKKDFLVKYKNAEYLQQCLQDKEHKYVRLDDEGHFFIFKKPELIADQLTYFNPTTLVLK